MRDQTIVIVSPGFPKDEAESTCLPYLQMFIKALKREHPNLKIKIVSLQYPFYSREYSWHGCNVVAIGGKNKKANRLYTWYKSKRAIQTIIKNENVIGIVSMWLTECTLIVQKLASKNNVPLIAWSWGQDVKKENRYIKLLNFNLFTTAVVSPSSRDLLLKNHGIKADLILSNGVDVDSIPQHEELDRSIDLLCVGSLNDFKRFDWLVDIVKELKNNNIKAKIIGDGPEREKIELKIKEAELQNQIELLGELQHTECLKWMNKSKILIHPSSFEGASTVILEALYYGCQVVSYTVPAEKMPYTFSVALSKAEMIEKVKLLLNQGFKSKSILVSSCSESADKLVNLLKSKKLT